MSIAQISHRKVKREVIEFLIHSYTAWSINNYFITRVIWNWRPGIGSEKTIFLHWLLQCLLWVCQPQLRISWRIFVVSVCPSTFKHMLLFLNWHSSHYHKRLDLYRIHKEDRIQHLARLSILSHILMLHKSTAIEYSALQILSDWSERLG